MYIINYNLFVIFRLRSLRGVLEERFLQRLSTRVKKLLRIHTYGEGSIHLETEGTPFEAPVIDTGVDKDLTVALVMLD